MGSMRHAPQTAKETALCLATAEPGKTRHELGEVWSQRQRWALDGQLHLVEPLGLKDELQQGVARAHPCRELQRVQRRHLHPRSACVHVGWTRCSEALVSTNVGEEVKAAARGTKAPRAQHDGHETQHCSWVKMDLFLLTALHCGAIGDEVVLP